jgi:hypothetical protein
MAAGSQRCALARQRVAAARQKGFGIMTLELGDADTRPEGI